MTSTATSQSQTLRRALVAVEQLQARLDAVERTRHEPIAIVGIGCRFPGGASDPQAFWRLLREGTDAITEVPPDRWDVDAYFDPDPDAPGKMMSRWGAFLERIDEFDAPFFGITPREASAMDPQQRLLLEVAWEALESAGIAPDRLAGSRTGVFVGIVNSDYTQLAREREDPSRFGAYHASGGAHSIASGRLSYLLGLQGPSISIDTACSSSLVAVHLAVQSLRAGECRLALAGGVNAILTPESSIAISKYRMLSPDGRCKTFDAAADGFARGEGCGLIALKRLSDAIVDGDRVLAVIRGSAVNQDGASSGLTAPNGPAQEAVLRDALADGGVAPADVTYVEAHGTGTSLGDPIEVQALAAVLGRGRGAERPVLIGSVKTNLGHLESAAGIAGLIKLVLCLQHRQIPPHLHLHTPNPLIAWERLPVRVAQEPIAWPENAPVVGGVSSFGFSGTNAHLILEAAPDLPRPEPEQRRPLHLLALSGYSEKALRDIAARVAEHLADGAGKPLGDVAHTANAGRAHLRHRLALRADSTEDARAQLEAFLAGREVATVHSGAAAPGDPPRIAFLFTGQGSQYVGMGRQLFETEPVFRAALERCDEILHPHLERPLLSLLYPPPDAAAEAEAASLLEQTAYTQPALFAVEYALAELWRSWGIEPYAVLGHSVGEYVAACVAGVFGLEAGLALIAERARLMQALPEGGGMAAVFADAAVVERATAGHTGRLAIAAVNGPANVVISGDDAALAAVLGELEAAGIGAKRLPVSHAFHSPLMEPVLERFAAIASRVSVAPPRMRLVSNLTGQLATAAELADPDRWVQHIRRPVQFARGVETLRREGVSLFVEVGPGATLLGMAQPEGDATGAWVPSLRRGRDDWAQMLDSLASLYVHGASVNWERMDRPYAYRPVAWPTYCFQRQRHWIVERVGRRRARVAADGAHPLLGSRLRSALPEKQYEVELAAQSFGFIADHRVRGVAMLPAAAYAELAFAAAAEQFRGADGLAVEDLIIAEPLVFQNDEARSVQTLIDRDAGFRVLSQGENEERWVLHATGRLATATTRPESEPLSSVQARCPEVRSAAEHYEAMRAHGLDFGPAMHGVAEIHRRDGEALGRIVAPDPVHVEAGRFRLHPAMLDACLQVLGAALPSTAVPAPYLPLGIEAFRLFDRPSGELWSHVVLHAASGPLPETLRGDVRLLDRAGRVLAEAEGLSLRRADSALAQRDPLDEWLYEVEWRALEAAAGGSPWATSTHALADRITADLPAAADRFALDSDDEATARIDALSAIYVAAAFRGLGLRFEPGERWTRRAIIDGCGVLPHYERLLDRLLAMLADEGVLARNGTSGWEVRRAPQLADPEAQWDDLLARYPHCEALLQLTRACGTHLADVLTGRVDPLSLLFPGGSHDVVERLYRDSPRAQAFNSVVRDALAEAVARTAPGRTLRVLEVGAGTGGTTAYLLPILPRERTDYVFTDISPAFLARARERFTDFEFVRYEPLDIEREPAAQGLAGRQFDLVIAVNVLHATADLAQTLGHVRSLLAPDGMLILGEATAPERWIDITFGLTDGWWRFTDTAVRSDHPLLPPGRWAELLAAHGFDEIAAAPADAERYGRAILLARAAGEPVPAKGSWLLVGANTGCGERVAELLRARGEQCVLAPADAADAIRELIGDVAQQDRQALRGIVHLAALEVGSPAAATSLEPLEQQVCGTVLDMLQALGGLAVDWPQLWLVSRGAQPAGPPSRVAVAQAPLWGLATILRAEHPELRCVTVDLDPALDEEEQAEALLAELASPDGEDRVAFRSGTRYGARLVRSRAVIEASPVSPLRLVTARTGLIEDLAWTPMARRAPGRGEVEIRVAATGLNFRDVMNALRMRDDRDPLGGECSGRVVAVGEDVDDFAVGDEVIAIALGGFGTFVTVPANLVLARPRALTLVQAAGQSLAFLTAYYCLHRLARIAAGERILIHAGAGGVGLAAVRLAQRTGAEIFATAGSAEKRDYLRSLGVRHVFDSRSTRFADEVLAATHGRGVDIVLNSLAGEFIPSSLAALAQAGRFLEIGKRDIWTAEDVARVKPRAEYHVVDLAARLHANPVSVAPIFREAMQPVLMGEIEPLPVRTFPQERVAEAFRFMAQARHTGKIVVTQAIEPAGPRGDATYLITGGTGGLGLLTARWLAERGAGTLVLMGRRPASEQALAGIAEIGKLGPRVVPVQGDVSQVADVRRVLEQIGRELPPLRGIVHSVGVLEDGALLRQDWSQFARVLAPKVDGAWLLHTLTRDQPLDFFILYSSIAAILGSPGQANHAAANAFLDALAHDRRAAGRPALSIGWGVWSQVGSAAARGTAERVAGQGVGAIAPEQGRRVLDALAFGDRVCVAVQPIDWRRRPSGADAGSPWLSELLADVRSRAAARSERSGAHSPDDAGAGRPRFVDRLLAAPAGERRELLMAHVHDQVASVMGMNGGHRVDPRQSFSELGLDSLMAVELRNRLGSSLGGERALPATLVFDYPTIEVLTDYLMADLLGEATDRGEGRAALSPETAPAALIDQIEGMSDDDVERLFAGLGEA
jgi:acyl transferase domain-containing protein/NADPH:quinone reductase-like Zn-dependent oxidoreductase